MMGRQEADQGQLFYLFNLELTPDFVTQMCNRFWIGRAELPT
jgi:hypothetical protein